MKKLYLLFLCLFMLSGAFAQKFRVDELYRSGPEDKRINVVILGDGFTEEEMDQFRVEANKFKDFFLNYEPFAHYKKYFNFFSVSTPSAESGVTNPGTAPDKYPNQPVVTVNNFYGSSFGTYTHRGVGISNYQLMYSVLAENVPSYDLVLMIANSPYYGGTGGSIAVYTLDPNASEIAVHEIGHAFSRLTDEYWPGGGGENINSTKETNPQLVRWKNWLGYSNIGIFPYGETTDAFFWKKPTPYHCLMYALNLPFCAVCREATVERILAYVHPIDSISPSSDLEIVVKNSRTFNLSLLLPEPNTIKVEWQLNGKKVGENSSEQRIAKDQLSTNKNVLTAKVFDDTPLSRKDNRQNSRSFSVSWQLIQSSITGIQTTTIVHPSTCGGANGKIEFDSDLPDGIYKLGYTKNNTSDSASVTIRDGFFTLANLPEGEYKSFTITINNKNIVNTTTVLLKNPPAPKFSVAAIENPGTCGGNNGRIKFDTDLKNDFYILDYTKNETIIRTAVTVYNGGFNLDSLNKGKYSGFTVTNSLNCMGKDTNTQTLADPVIPIPAASNTGPYYEGDTIKLSVTDGGKLYRWSGPLSFTSNFQNPELTRAILTQEGVYEVFVIYANNCQAMATTTVKVSPILSVSSNIDYQWLKVYPNPARDFVKIEVEHTGESEATLYSVDGRILKQLSFSKEILLNTTGLGQGNYLLKIRNGLKESTIKLAID